MCKIREYNYHRENRVKTFARWLLEAKVKIANQILEKNQGT